MEYKYSNCLFEAIKAKLKDLKNVHIHFHRSDVGLIPHFWWEDKKGSWEFVSKKLNRKYQVFLFKGYTREYIKGLYHKSYKIQIMTKKKREAIIAQNKIDYPELYEDEKN